jgi:hypothetical protein
VERIEIGHNRTEVGIHDEYVKSIVNKASVNPNRPLVLNYVYHEGDYSSVDELRLGSIWSHYDFFCFYINFTNPNFFARLMV